MTRSRRHPSDDAVLRHRPSARRRLLAVAGVAFTALLTALPCWTPASADDPPVEPTTIVVTVPVTLPPSTEPPATQPPSTTPPTEAPTTAAPTTEPGSAPVPPRPRVTTRPRTTAAPARSTTTATTAPPEETAVPPAEPAVETTTTAPRGTAPLAAAISSPPSTAAADERPPTRPTSDRAPLPLLVPLALVGVVIAAAVGLFLRRRSSPGAPNEAPPPDATPPSPAVFAPRTADGKTFVLFAEAAPDAPIRPVTAADGPSALAALFPPRPQVAAADRSTVNRPARLDWGARTNDSPRRHR